MQTKALREAANDKVPGEILAPQRSARREEIDIHTSMKRISEEFKKAGTAKENGKAITMASQISYDVIRHCLLDGISFSELKPKLRKLFNNDESYLRLIREATLGLADGDTDTTLDDHTYGTTAATRIFVRNRLKDEIEKQLKSWTAEQFQTEALRKAKKQSCESPKTAKRQNPPRPAADMKSLPEDSNHQSNSPPESGDGVWAWCIALAAILAFVVYFFRTWIVSSKPKLFGIF